MTAKELIKEDKEHYGKLYYDITSAIDEISPFLSEEELGKRKFVSRLPVLKKYIEALEASESEIDKEGIFKLFKGDKYSGLLNSYKNDNEDELKQLEMCSRCMCRNCTGSCAFDGCMGCRNGQHIVKCDKKKINVSFHDSFTVDLTNQKTGVNKKYKVLATMQDIEVNRRYIIIGGMYSIDKDEKYILYYYPKISEDEYGEITDENEFDKIVETYESIPRG